MNRYYLKYKELTGLGAPVQTKWFETIEERFKFYMSGVQVVGFGQDGGEKETGVDGKESF